MAAAKFGKINLLPKDSFELSVLGKILKWALTSGRILVVLTEFVVILAFGSRFYFDKKLNDLIEVIGQKQAVVESYVDIENKIRDLLSRQAVVDKYLKENLEISEVINQIKRVTPVDVSFTEISVDEAGFSLTGMAGSEGGLASLLVGVNNISSVTGISVGSIDYDQRQGAINFKISVVVNKT
ncbi:PilN domain-containing protein [Candidatus Collierbacteria bacterium]|nr:PilN domain-containing protein [Candidatus Collierbacteria bacterium]